MTPDSTTPKKTGSIWAGIGLSLACQLFTFLFLVMWMVISDNRYVYFAVLVSGLFQWILVLPLIVRLRSRGKKATAKGALIFSLVGVLINVLVVALIMANGANNTRFN